MFELSYVFMFDCVDDSKGGSGAVPLSGIADMLSSGWVFVVDAVVEFDTKLTLGLVSCVRFVVLCDLFVSDSVDVLLSAGPVAWAINACKACNVS